MTIRCVIYSRYSSEAQNAKSAADQTAACRRVAEALGWRVVDVYEDAAVSGASRFRPEYQRMLADAEVRRFDVVLCEALDRLSRRLTDIAWLFDRLTFLGLYIHTGRDGRITPMHIAMLGMVSQMYLDDLRHKTRRGLEAVARDGRSAGGLSYGYRVAVGGKRGGREIDEIQAQMVRRIFQQYGAGVSPKQIALSLNAEAVPGPRGGHWSPSAINGNRQNGTGVLNNEVYVGRMTWNRRTWLKDPATGKRLARANDAAALVAYPVPELRIVSDELWQAVKVRQGRLDQGLARTNDAAVVGGSAEPTPFWTKQRPRYLFSGLMRCGVCGGGFSKISQHHFGCSTARNQGPTACTNLLTIRRDVLEETVISALRDRLMDPELFKAFAEAFTAEWNRLQAEASAGFDAKRQELERVERQLNKLVDALTEGAPFSAIKARMGELEARKVVLAQEVAGAEAPAPRLHPSMAEVYRARVAELTAALAADDGAELRERVRALVETIRLIPEAGKLRVEVRGELGAILRLAEGARNAKGPGVVAEALVVQIKGDAGTGFEPVTFRL